MNCVGEMGMEPFIGGSFEQATYSAVPDPKFTFVGPLGAFSEIASALADPHREFIRLAGTTKSGRPRSGSPNRRSHCQALIDYAEEFLAWVEESPDGAVGIPHLFREGKPITVRSSRFERDPEARRVCLDHYGSACIVCGFRSDQVFGGELTGIIHVHHVTPLSSVAMEHQIDPVKDLRPVCPNCHAAIHSRNPAYGIDEIKAALKKCVLSGWCAATV
jgi:hypothetical protein